LSKRTVRGGARLVVVAILGALVVGFFIGRGFEPTAATASAVDATQAEVLWTCSMHPQVVQATPGLCPICHMALTPLAERSSDGAIAVDAAVVQALGVRTARVTRTSSVRAVRALGTLMERDFDHVDVNLRVSGWIESLVANQAGMVVTKGDTLFTLASPELSIVVDELIAARKQRETDGARSDGIGSALFSAAKRRLSLLGLSEEEIERLSALDAAPASIPFRSPMSGHIPVLEVSAGTAVKAGDRVMRIANNHILWAEMRVATRDGSRIAVGSTFRAEISGDVVEGRITIVHPHVNMDGQTLLVRGEIANPDGRRREGESFTAAIAPQASETLLAVPRAAVIDTGTRNIAFVALGGGRFEPRELKLGPDLEDGQVAVSSGVVEGEEVVASGQFLLDSESRLRESLSKFMSSGSDVTKLETSARPLWASAVDPLVERYLALADRLGETQENATPLDARAYVDTARDLVQKSASDARVVAVLASAEPLLTANLAAQRELFKKASEALLDLVAGVPPSAKIGGSQLYIVKCPMAPGRWLQREPGIKNPYYAEIMKECGEVVRPLSLEKGDER